VNASKLTASAEGLSQGDKYGIGFGVGFGVIGLLGCGACLGFYCRRQRPSDPVIVLAERRGSAVAERRGSSAPQAERRASSVERQATTVERRGSKAALQLRSSTHSSSV
jgi:hypothetical protein